MGLTRLGTDGLLPQKDFSQFTATPSVINTPQKLTVTRTLAERVLLFAPKTNPADVQIGPTSAASYRALSPGDEFLIPNDAGTSVDISTWYFQSTSTSATLTIIYQ